MMNVIIGETCVVNYLSDCKQINKFPKDLQIHSEDGTKFYFNRLLLISCSELISRILKSIQEVVLQERVNCFKFNSLLFLKATFLGAVKLDRG